MGINRQFQAKVRHRSLVDEGEATVTVTVTADNPLARPLVESLAAVVERELWGPDMSTIHIVSKEELKGPPDEWAAVSPSPRPVEVTPPAVIEAAPKPSKPAQPKGKGKGAGGSAGEERRQTVQERLTE
jgi:hypothetical protein